MVLKSAGGSPATSYSANNDSLFKALAKKEYDSRKLASTPVKTTPTKSAQLRRAATMQVDEEKNEEGEGQENQEAKGGSTGSRRKSTSSVYTYSKSSVDSTPSKLSSRLVGPVKEDADVQGKICLYIIPALTAPNCFFFFGY